jgi:hypothetical protein
MGESIGAHRYMECSARTGEGLKEVFEHAARLAITKGFRGDIEQATSSNYIAGDHSEQVDNVDQATSSNINAGNQSEHVGNSTNNAGHHFKSSLFDNLNSSIPYDAKLPQDWNQNDVVLWLQHNDISKQSIESFKGISLKTEL